MGGSCDFDRNLKRPGALGLVREPEGTHGIRGADRVQLSPNELSP
jgi:hypothetical protein